MQPIGVDPPVRDLLDGVSAVIRAVRCAEHRQNWPDAGIRRADAGVLRVLASAGELRTGDLAHRLGVDASVVSRQLSSLEADGLVSRHPDRADARVSLASVTDTGRERLAGLHAAFADRLHTALADWSDDRIATTATALHRLAAVIAAPLDKPGTEPDDRRHQPA